MRRRFNRRLEVNQDRLVRFHGTLVVGFDERVVSGGGWILDDDERTREGARPDHLHRLPVQRSARPEGVVTLSQARLQHGVTAGALPEVKEGALTAAERQGGEGGLAKLRGARMERKSKGNGAFSPRRGMRRGRGKK